MKATTLPEGWVGNLAHHHREVGPFRVRVFRVRPSRRFFWEVLLGGSVGVSEIMVGHPTPEEARSAAIDRLRQLAAEVIHELGGTDG